MSRTYSTTLTGSSGSLASTAYQADSMTLHDDASHSVFCISNWLRRYDFLYIDPSVFALSLALDRAKMSILRRCAFPFSVVFRYLDG